MHAGMGSDNMSPIMKRSTTTEIHNINCFSLKNSLQPVLFDYPQKNETHKFRSFK